MAADRILIENLLVRGVVGVHDWERKERQDVLINIALEADLGRAIERDDLEGSIDYRALAKQIIHHVETAERYTVEALAGDLARICLDRPGAERVRVRVEKPGALRFASSVGVEIEREAIAR